MVIIDIDVRGLWLALSMYIGLELSNHVKYCYIL